MTPLRIEISPLRCTGIPVVCMMQGMRAQSRICASQFSSLEKPR